MTVHVVIPARFGSTRLPGKPLVDIGGQPMVVRVAQQAARSGADDVVVAVDDQRVATAVEAPPTGRVVRAIHEHFTDHHRI